MKHTAEVVLRALFAGRAIDLPGHKLPIQLIREGEPINPPGRPGQAAADTLVYCLSSGEHLGCEINLAEFIRACAKMDEAQRISLVGSLALASSRLASARL